MAKEWEQQRPATAREWRVGETEEAVLLCFPAFLPCCAAVLLCCCLPACMCTLRLLCRCHDSTRFHGGQRTVSSSTYIPKGVIAAISPLFLRPARSGRPKRAHMISLGCENVRGQRRDQPHADPAEGEEHCREDSGPQRRDAHSACSGQLLLYALAAMALLFKIEAQRRDWRGLDVLV